MQRNDSIVRIATLTKEEQTAFFENYIEKIKEADEAAAQLRLNQMAFANPISGLQPAKKGEWYFYNSQSLSFGKSEFFKIWGNRRLEDNWRWSEKASIGITTKDSTAVNKVNIKYDLDTYLSTIPKEQSEIDSLIITRNEALYELGLIYKEQFKNLDLAKQRLERVNDLNEDEALVLPINWHLYQLYTSLDNETEAEQYKNVILTKYPETKFAQVILNPNVVFSDEVEVNEVERKYKELYYLYKDDKFNEVITQIDAFLPSIPNAALLPKFELLKALAIGKFKTKEEYKAALDYIVVSYGNTEEAEKAKAIVAQLK